MIIIVPFLIFLLVADFVSFNNSFYKKGFSKYNVYKSVPQADSLHSSVINFVNGKSNDLPSVFNNREKQHLLDVRNTIRNLRILLHILGVLFIFLLIFYKKTKKQFNNLIGQTLFFGGLLTIAVSMIIFLLINFDFSTSFESFHRLFFEKGSYLFDPTREIIVRLYPEQLFMDIGIRISKWVFALSAIFIAIGMFLIKQNKKNKNRRK